MPPYEGVRLTRFFCLLNLFLFENSPWVSTAKLPAALDKEKPEKKPSKFNGGKFSKSKGIGVFGNDAKAINIPVEGIVVFAYEAGLDASSSDAIAMASSTSPISAFYFTTPLFSKVRASQPSTRRNGRIALNGVNKIGLHIHKPMQMNHPCAAIIA
ncbi:putative methionine--tRNA ligase [Senna tora]|uniref:Putative methionine--tRNA ligase n=1 Tax=Senna tora TaxID=362788 RepID=A0A834WSY2_9FABA|nr:putative methionine--tRNA ligase [Senna tora]